MGRGLTDPRVLRAASCKRCRWRHARGHEINTPDSHYTRNAQAPAAFGPGRQGRLVTNEVITISSWPSARAHMRSGAVGEPDRLL